MCGFKIIPAASVERLQAHRWPGNVRELENLIRRIAALHPEETVLPEIIDRELASVASPQGSDQGDDTGGLSGYLENHLARQFASFSDGLPPPGLYHRVLSNVEPPLIRAALAATKGNQIKAAELLGLNRNTLRTKIRTYGIQVVRGL